MKSVIKVNLWLTVVCLMLSSCENAPEMAVFSDEIIIDAIQTEPATIDISANVEWTITVFQSEELWLTVSPLQGKGDATITLEAAENTEFAERIAFIAITGEDVYTDTIKVVQAPTLDVVEKIEDEIFKQFCLDEYDHSPKDGKISKKEALNAIEIKVKGMKISSLAGIEYFTNLRKLDCSDNKIKEIDVSKNRELRTLDCSINPISAIEVDELPKLSDLQIHSTNIKKIDVSKNVELYMLITSNSPITSLNVLENKELAVLLCSDNQLTDLDVSKNSKLLMLHCPNNKISTLNLSMNPNLVNLWCNNQTGDNNKKLLTTLDMSHNKNLQILSCAQNGITNLQLTNNPDLIQLRCEDNQLISLDVRQNTKLVYLKCNDNKLKDNIDISNNKLLKDINIRNNQDITTIYVWQGFDENCTSGVDGKIKCYEKDEHAKWVKK